MTRKMILAVTVVAGMVGCGGRGDAKVAQAGYETVQEGSAAGVTSTIHGPGETLPPITGTNADTTTAFTLDPNAAAAAGSVQPAQPSTMAGTLPPPSSAPMTYPGSPAPAPVTRTPAPAPSSPSQPRQVYVPQPAPSPAPAPQRPAPAPEPAETEPAPQQPAEGTDTATTQPAPPPAQPTETAPPPKQEKPKQEQPKQEQAPPADEEPEEEPPPPPPPAR